MPEPIRIDYYTDPICSWCYAAEEMLERARAHFQDRIALRYKLFPLFDDVREVLNNPARLWDISDRYRIVSKKTKTHINNTVWTSDPPASAWPACEAVKAGERQGFDAADRLIKRLRNAVMCDGLNIARREIILQCASVAGLNLKRFEQDLSDPGCREEVERDVADAVRDNVESRPTFVLTNSQGDKVLIAGLRSFDFFRHAVDELYREQPEI